MKELRFIMLNFLFAFILAAPSFAKDVTIKVDRNISTGDEIALRDLYDGYGIGKAVQATIYAKGYKGKAATLLVKKSDKVVKTLVVSKAAKKVSVAKPANMNLASQGNVYVSKIVIKGNGQDQEEEQDQDQDQEQEQGQPDQDQDQDQDCTDQQGQDCSDQDQDTDQM